MKKLGDLLRKSKKGVTSKEREHFYESGYLQEIIPKNLNYDHLFDLEWRSHIEKNAQKYSLVFLVMCLVFLVFVKSSLITGYVINNSLEVASNVGIIICVIGIIGLLVLKLRSKK
ncbi:MAG: hypothetical protein ABIA78_04250 [archaeon]